MDRIQVHINKRKVCSPEKYSTTDTEKFGASGDDSSLQLLFRLSFQAPCKAHSRCSTMLTN